MLFYVYVNKAPTLEIALCLHEKTDTSCYCHPQASFLVSLWQGHVEYPRLRRSSRFNKDSIIDATPVKPEALPLSVLFSIVKKGGNMFNRIHLTRLFYSS